MGLAELQALLDRGRYLEALQQAREMAADESLAVEPRVDALLLAVRAASLRQLHTEHSPVAKNRMEVIRMRKFLVALTVLAMLTLAATPALAGPNDEWLRAAAVR